MSVLDKLASYFPGTRTTSPFDVNPDWEDADEASQREYEAQLAYKYQQYQCYEDAEHLSD